MKRKIAVLLIFTLLLTSVGCSSGKKSSRNNRDDDDEIEETDDTENTDDTDETADTASPESSVSEPAHTDKPEPETSASTDTSSSSETGTGSSAIIADLIGTVDGDRYVSSYTGVEYTLGKDMSYGDREVLQSSYGAVDVNAKISDANMMIPIAGTYIAWPDGSNLSICYQVNPLFVEDAMSTYLEANRSASETAIKGMGFEVDKSEVTKVTVGSKLYDAIVIDSHNSTGQKVNQVMVMTYNNGVTIFATTTSVGKYTADDMLKGLKLP